MLPTEQAAAQIAQAALQAPINNLVILLALVALLVMGLGVFLVWKFAPALINLYKQQAATNEKLTEIVGQNAEQAKLAMGSVDANTDEMVKQTAAVNTSIDAINNQTRVIEVQNLNHNNYQTLVSDNLNAHTEQIAANTENIAQLKTSVDELTEQIKAMLEDKAECEGVEKLLEKFKDELVEIVLQQRTKTATSTQPAVNVIPDTTETVNGEAA